MGDLYPNLNMYDKLPCQELVTYHHLQKGKANIHLPSDFLALPNPKYETDQKTVLYQRLEILLCLLIMLKSNTLQTLWKVQFLHGLVHTH